VAGHGDNLIFLLEDATLKGSVVSALTSSVAEHFGDDVLADLTSRISYDTPAHSFSFCRARYRMKGGIFSKSLDPQIVARFSERTILAIGDALSANDQAAFDKIERSIFGWLGQNRDKKMVLNEAAELLAHLKAMRK